MTKKELLDKLSDLLEQCAESKRNYCESVMNEIKQKLECFPKDYCFETLASVSKYVFSRIPVSSDTVVILDAINSDLSDYINSNVSERERNAQRTLDRKKKIGMYIFLGFIICLAVGAIICLIADFLITEDSDSRGIIDKLGSAFGLLDFTLGAVGFVWERVSDMKNEDKKLDLHTQAEKVQGSKTNEERNKTTFEFAKAYQKCVKIFQFGFVNFTIIRE